MIVLAVLAALASAFCGALSSVLQREAASTGRARTARGLRLMPALLRRPLYLTAVLSMTAGFALHAFALSQGRLSLVQPLLVVELLFVLLMAAFQGRVGLGRQGWAGTGLVVAGLAGFLTVTSLHRGIAHPYTGTVHWILAVLVVAAVVDVVVVVAGAVGGARRAALLGAATGMSFGLVAALTKSWVTRAALVGPLASLASWHPYAVVATGVGAAILAAHTFRSGPLVWSQPAITMADPLSAIALGVVVLHGPFPTALPLVVIALASLAVVTAGVVLLSRAMAAADRVGLPPGRRPTPVVPAVREDPARVKVGSPPS